MRIASIFFIIFYMLCCKLSAQSLTPAVISTSGGFTANGTAMLSFTAGEMTMVETFYNAGSVLTQGFQQPEDFNVSVKDIEIVNKEISIGPNPTHGLVNMFFDTKEALRLNISVLDMAGRIFYSGEIEKLAGNNFVRMNLSSVACGDYFIECLVAGRDESNPNKFYGKISIID